jgi:CO/xanthine dehydrogenase Mo-binding subunit
MTAPHLEGNIIPKSRQQEKPRDDFTWIGKSMKRVEDPRFLTGKGRYVDDISLPNMAHAAVLMSPHAHARIVSIDTSRAEALPGVVGVYTGRDIAEVVGPAPASPARRSRSIASPSTGCAMWGRASRLWWRRAATSPRMRWT